MPGEHYKAHYARFSFRLSKSSSFIEKIIYTRCIPIVKPRYRGLIDELEAVASHNDQLFFYTKTEIKTEVGADKRVILGVLPYIPNFYLFPIEPQDIKAGW